jgi:hypothetical protein
VHEASHTVLTEQAIGTGEQLAVIYNEGFRTATTSGTDSLRNSNTLHNEVKIMNEQSVVLWKDNKVKEGREPMKKGKCVIEKILPYEVLVK